MPSSQAAFNSAGGGEDPVFSSLKRVFELDDAEHIFQAVKAKCDYFLTLDRSTIIDRVHSNRDFLARICPNMEIVDPGSLLARLRTP